MKKLFYRVQKGDTINKIALRFNVPPLSIITYNNVNEEVNCGDILVIRKFNYKIYSVAFNENLQSVLKKVIDKDAFFIANGNVKYLCYGMQVYLT